MKTSKESTAKVNWDDQKERLKEQFSGLTDNDLYFEQGKMEDMLENLQHKIGKTRHELHLLIAKH